jgi:hypothetical protein
MSERYLDEWATIANSVDFTTELTRHFQFLAETEACQPLLGSLMSRAMEVVIERPGEGPEGTTTPRLRVTFPYMEDGEPWPDEQPADLWCSPPFVGTLAGSVAPSVERVVRAHNGIELKSRSYDIPFVFHGLDPRGEIDDAYSWERSNVSPTANQDLLQRLTAQGLSVADLRVPIADREDWVLFDPFRRNELGEASLCRISHADGLVQGPLSRTLGFAGILLRLLCASAGSATPEQMGLD